MKIGNRNSIDKVYSTGTDPRSKTQGSVAFLSKYIRTCISEKKQFTQEENFIKILKSIDPAQEVPHNLYEIISRFLGLNSG